MAAVFIIKLVNWCFIITIGQATITPPKSVNLALETSFLFEPHDMQQNASMLSNIRSFLNKLEYLLSPKESREPIFRALNVTIGKNENDNAKNENNSGNNDNDSGNNENDNGNNENDSGNNYDDSGNNENDNGNNENDNGNNENDSGNHENDNGNNENDSGKSRSHNGKKGNNSGRLTKFLTELGGIVINYDDDEVKGLTAALNDEIATNHVENPKFHDMIRDMTTRMFIKNTVQEWTTTDPLKLKVEIAKYITRNEGDAFVTFFHNINEFFDNDKTKLKKLVKRYQKARQNKRFSKTLKKTFDLIYDRFEKLDEDSKNRWREEFDKLTRHVVLNFKHRLSSADGKSRRSGDATVKDLSESLNQDFSSDNSIDNVKVDANEIRIDKDVQVSVHTDNLNIHKTI